MSNTTTEDLTAILADDDDELVQEPERSRAAPLGHIAEHGVIEPQSVRDRVRAGAQRHRARSSIDVLLPGYDDLYVTFRQLSDYTAIRDRYLKRLRQQGQSDAQMEIGIAIETLLAASTGSYAQIDGERYDLPGEGLGIELYDEIWGGDEDAVVPTNDAQALTLMFLTDEGLVNTVQITSLAAELEAWFKDTTRAVGEAAGRGE